MGTQLTVSQTGLGSVNGDQLNTYEQTCDTAVELQGFVGTTGVQVNIRGINSIDDGFGGSFYWNATGTANDGLNNFQPTGVTVGTWTRVSANGSPAIWPLLEAPTIAAAKIILGIVSSPITAIVNPITTTYTVQNIDNGGTISAGGNAFYTITFNPAGSYPANFLVFLLNADSGRGKLVSINGSTFMLWPLQGVIALSTGTEFILIGGPSRWQVPSAIIMYASPSGVATNDGLGPDAPMDLQSAINNVTRGGTTGFGAGIDLNARSLVIQLADGTYNGQYSVTNAPFGNSVFAIQGNVATPSNVQVISGGAGQDTFTFRDNGKAQLQYLELACGAGGAAIFPGQGGVCDLSNVVFGSCDGGNMITLQDGGACNFLGPISLSGNAVAFINTDGGHCSLGGQTITATMPVSFTNFIDMSSGLVDSLAGPANFANPGFVSGVAWNVTANGVLNRNGSVIPGSAGTTSSGGQVI